MLLLRLMLILLLRLRVRLLLTLLLLTRKHGLRQKCAVLPLRCERRLMGQS